MYGRLNVDNVPTIRYRMDTSKAMATLGFSTSRLLEDTSMGEIQTSFMFRVHAIEMQPAHDAKAKQSKRDQLRRLNEAYQYLRRKQKAFSGRSMAQNWQVAGGKGKMVQQVLTLKTEEAKTPFHELLASKKIEEEEEEKNQAEDAKNQGSVQFEETVDPEQAQSSSPASSKPDEGATGVEKDEAEEKVEEGETNEPNVPPTDNGGDNISIASMSSCSIPDLSGESDMERNDSPLPTPCSLPPPPPPESSKGITLSSSSPLPDKPEVNLDNAITPAEFHQEKPAAAFGKPVATGAISKAFVNTVWEKAALETAGTLSFFEADKKRSGVDKTEVVKKSKSKSKKPKPKISLRSPSATTTSIANGHAAKELLSSLDSTAREAKKEGSAKEPSRRQKSSTPKPVSKERDHHHPSTPTASAKKLNTVAPLKTTLSSFSRRYADIRYSQAFVSPRLKGRTNLQQLLLRRLHSASL